MKSSTRLIIVSCLALAIPLLCGYFMRDLLFKGVVATYEEAALNQSEYRDKWISYEVIACFGEYAESTETHYFIPTGHEYYYLVWMEDGSIMPLSVSKKSDKEYLDALSDATYDYCDYKTEYIDMEPRTFIGTVTTQDSEILGYYNETLDYMGTSEANGWTIRYTLLDCTSTRGGTIALVCAVMLIPILGFVTAFTTARKEKKKVENQEETFLPK